MKIPRHKSILKQTEEGCPGLLTKIRKHELFTNDGSCCHSYGFNNKMWTNVFGYRMNKLVLNSDCTVICTKKNKKQWGVTGFFILLGGFLGGAIVPQTAIVKRQESSSSIRTNFTLDQIPYLTSVSQKHVWNIINYSTGRSTDVLWCPQYHSVANLKVEDVLNEALSSFRRATEENRWKNIVTSYVAGALQHNVHLHFGPTNTNLLRPNDGPVHVGVLRPTHRRNKTTNPQAYGITQESRSIKARLSCTPAFQGKGTLF